MNLNNYKEMKFIDEYRDTELIGKLSRAIKRKATGNYTFMEVCGGHTAAIHRFGIPSLLSKNIKLISGPGCPVCVTGKKYIDTAIALSRLNGMIITTFGDLLRLPGSFSSLEKEKAAGADVRIVFSGLDALEIAKANPERKVVFLGVGFETTAPGTAITVLQAKKEKLNNFFLLGSHKIMPPAMETVISQGVRIDGFICPGHVAAITGADAFRFIPDKYRLGCVISGFEPADILQSVLMLVDQVNERSPSVEIQYRRAVTPGGSISGKKFLAEVFELFNDEWRGLGVIPLSGLRLRGEYGRYDASKVFSVEVKSLDDNKLCICGDILRGVKIPPECRLFGSSCSPENPYGACMVSSEGACNAYYKFGKNE